jgi:hypothetical protein
MPEESKQEEEHGIHYPFLIRKVVLCANCYLHIFPGYCSRPKRQWKNRRICAKVPYCDWRTGHRKQSLSGPRQQMGRRMPNVLRR